MHAEIIHGTCTGEAADMRWTCGKHVPSGSGNPARLFNRHTQKNSPYARPPQQSPKKGFHLSTHASSMHRVRLGAAQQTGACADAHSHCMLPRLVGPCKGKFACWHAQSQGWFSRRTHLQYTPAAMMKHVVTVCQGNF